MISQLLGYVGYGMINLWAPLQIALLLRSRTIDLGRLPLSSLVLGMACLQVGFALDHLPLYTQAGNATGLLFTSITLAIVSRRIGGREGERR